MFLTTLMYVLIEDGSAMRPPIGSVTLRNVAHAAESEREARFAEARGDGLESGAEVLRVEGAAPDHHGEPRDGERLQADPDLRQAVEEEEDLDEDRRVPDHLDVDRRELADDGHAMRPRRAENEPDHKGTGDRDRRHPERALQPGEELVGVLLDERPEVGEEPEREDCAHANEGAAACAAAPSVDFVPATGTPS